MPLPLPSVLLKATSISWTMESNHGAAESPFSGLIQSQRSRLERWSFVMEIRKMNRARAQVAIGFFLQLEGNLNTFTMHDPAAPEPLGPAIGSPVVSTSALAGARTVLTSGWAPNCPAILRAGDWVQIGDQLSRLRADAPSNAAGLAELDVWPKLMIPMPAGTPIKTRPATGIFRFTSDLPSYDVIAGYWQNHAFKLTGSQEILRA